LPKAGKYDYPFFDLDACIEKLDQYYKVVKTDETSRQLVAETLEMSMTGGGFVNLISSMEKYGLVETGRKNVTITQLGKSILFGESAEKEQMKKKAVSRIDLFRELYEQFGKDATPEQIRAFLRQKGNVDISKAQYIAGIVAIIYKKVSNYIVPAKKTDKLEPPSEIMESMGSRFGRRESITESVVGKEPLKIQKGGLYIEISDDPHKLENIEYAKDLLVFWEQKFKAKTEPKTTEPTKE
jgi:hypothetical protein